MTIAPKTVQPALAIAACLLCTLPLEARTTSRSCTPARAISLLKKHIVEDVVPDELRYTVRRTGKVLIISGRYKQPTIGFEPIARVDASRCRILQVKWR